MAISGINSFLSYGVGNSYQKDQAAINRLRLQQALQTPSVSKTKTQFTEKQGTSISDPLGDSLDFVKSYNSDMTDLMNSANTLRNANSGSVMNKVTANSSNADILSASGNFGVKAGKSYQVTVDQLAAAQVNRSEGVDSRAAANSDISLQVKGAGSDISIQIKAAAADGTQKSNRDMLEEAARAINGRSSGVTASVIEKDGKSSLQIAAKETGESNQFVVSGEFAEKTAMNKASQTAQDAKYRVSIDGGKEEAYTSSDNSVSMDYGKVSAELKRTGSATVSTGADNDKVASAVQDLVNDYNQALKTVKENAYRGEGASRQFSNMSHLPMSEKSLKQIGIGVQKDGTLSLDKAALQKSLKDSPNTAKDLIGGSFGLAQGVFQKASSARNVSASSLISSDIKQAEIESLDTTQIYSMYSRTSAYGMRNIAAVGMMFDMFA